MPRERCWARRGWGLSDGLRAFVYEVPALQDQLCMVQDIYIKENDSCNRNAILKTTNK